MVGRTRKEKRRTPSGDEYFVRVPDVDEGEKVVGDPSAAILQLQAELAALRGERAAELAAAGETPAYVTRLVDAVLAAEQVVDLEGVEVPEDVAARLAAEPAKAQPDAENKAVEQPAPASRTAGAAPAAQGKARS